MIPVRVRVLVDRRFARLAISALPFILLAVTPKVATCFGRPSIPEAFRICTRSALVLFCLGWAYRLYLRYVGVNGTLAVDESTTEIQLRSRLFSVRGRAAAGCPWPLGAAFQVGHTWVLLRPRSHAKPDAFATVGSRSRLAFPVEPGIARWHSAAAILVVLSSCWLGETTLRAAADARFLMIPVWYGSPIRDLTGRISSDEVAAFSSFLLASILALGVERATRPRTLAVLADGAVLRGWRTRVWRYADWPAPPTATGGIISLVSAEFRSDRVFVGECAEAVTEAIRQRYNAFTALRAGTPYPVERSVANG